MAASYPKPSGLYNSRHPDELLGGGGVGGAGRQEPSSFGFDYASSRVPYMSSYEAVSRGGVPDVGGIGSYESSFASRSRVDQASSAAAAAAAAAPTSDPAATAGGGRPPRLDPPASLDKEKGLLGPGAGRPQLDPPAAFDPPFMGGTKPALEPPAMSMDSLEPSARRPRLLDPPAFDPSGRPRAEPLPYELPGSGKSSGLYPGEEGRLSSSSALRFGMDRSGDGLLPIDTKRYLSSAGNDGRYGISPTMELGGGGGGGWSGGAPALGSSLSYSSRPPAGPSGHHIESSGGGIGGGGGAGGGGAAGAMYSPFEPTSGPVLQLKTRLGSPSSSLLGVPNQHRLSSSTGYGGGGGSAYESSLSEDVRSSAGWRESVRADSAGNLLPPSGSSRLRTHAGGGLDSAQDYYRLRDSSSIADTQDAHAYLRVGGSTSSRDGPPSDMLKHPLSPSRDPLLKSHHSLTSSSSLLERYGSEDRYGSVYGSSVGQSRYASDNWQKPLTPGPADRERDWDRDRDRSGGRHSLSESSQLDHRGSSYSSGLEKSDRSLLSDDRRYDSLRYDALRYDSLRYGSSSEASRQSYDKYRPSAGLADGLGPSSFSERYALERQHRDRVSLISLYGGKGGGGDLDLPSSRYSSSTSDLHLLMGEREYRHSRESHLAGLGLLSEREPGSKSTDLYGPSGSYSGRGGTSLRHDELRDDRLAGRDKGYYSSSMRDYLESRHLADRQLHLSENRRARSPSPRGSSRSYFSDYEYSQILAEERAKLRAGSHLDGPRDVGSLSSLRGGLLPLPPSSRTSGYASLGEGADRDRIGYSSAGLPDVPMDIEKDEVEYQRKVARLAEDGREQWEGEVRPRPLHGMADESYRMYKRNMYPSAMGDGIKNAPHSADEGFKRTVPLGDGEEAMEKETCRHVETKGWYEKRFVMTNQWGWWLPSDRLASTNMRDWLKWFSGDMVIHDASYHSVIELSGSQSSILEVLAQICDPDLPPCQPCGQQSSQSSTTTDPAVQAQVYMIGGVEGNMMIHSPGAFPWRAIAPARFTWRPAKGGGSTNAGEGGRLHRKIWMWVHPEAFKEAFEAVREACIAQVKSPVRFSARKSEIARFEVKGCGAQELIRRIVRPVDGEGGSVQKVEGSEGTGTTLAIPEQETASMQKIDNWIKLLPSGGILGLNVYDPRNARSNTAILDKRGDGKEGEAPPPEVPAKSAKRKFEGDNDGADDADGDGGSDDEEGNMEEDPTSQDAETSPLNVPDVPPVGVLYDVVDKWWLQFGCSGGVAELSDSQDLWDPPRDSMGRVLAGIPKPELFLSKRQMIKQRKLGLDPGPPMHLKAKQDDDNQAGNTGKDNSGKRTGRDEGYEVKCPVLLVNCGGSGASSRWSIIVPWRWAAAFWAAMTFVTTSAVGVAEWRHLITEMHCPAFPWDFPDTPAFLRQTWKEYAVIRDIFMRVPLKRDVIPRVPLLFDSVATRSRPVLSFEDVQLAEAAEALRDRGAPAYFVARSLAVWQRACTGNLPLPLVRGRERLAPGRDCLVCVGVTILKKGQAHEGAEICAVTVEDIESFNRGFKWHGLNSAFVHDKIRGMKFVDPIREVIGRVSATRIKGLPGGISIGFCNGTALLALRQRQQVVCPSHSRRLPPQDLLVLVRNLNSIAYRAALLKECIFMGSNINATQW